MIEVLTGAVAGVLIANLAMLASDMMQSRRDARNALPDAPGASVEASIDATLDRIMYQLGVLSERVRQRKEG